MALNNHVKWCKNNLKRHPFCFLCERRGGGSAGRWESVKTASYICTELKRLHKCGVWKWRSHGCLLGHSSRPEFVFPGPEFGCQADRGVLGFRPTPASQERLRAAQGLRVWKSIQADCLLCVYCWPTGGHARPSRCFQLGSHKQSMLPSLPWGLLCLSPPRPPGRVAKAPD